MADMPKKEALRRLIDYMQSTTYTHRDGSVRPVLEFRSGSRSWQIEGRGATPLGVVDHVAFEWPVSEYRMQQVVRKLGNMLHKAALDELVEWVADSEDKGVDDTAARELLRLIEHADTDPDLHECNLWALKQSIWQIKRNVMDRSVDYHSMLVFYGVQGSGKTEAVKRILTPMKDFCKNAKATQFNDQFGIRLLADSLVCFLDEFAGARDVDPAIFKALISGGDLEGRVIYGDSAFHGKNRLTFFATSNLAPPHGYRDPTGARRVWPVHCTDVPIKEDKQRRDALDSLPWADVWRCASAEWDNVQHRIPRHLQARMDVVRNDQVRSRHPIETFKEECLEEGDAKDRTPLGEVREAFDAHLRKTRQKETDLTLPNLQALLESVGLRCVNHQRYRFLCGHRLVDQSITDHVNKVNPCESASSHGKPATGAAKAAS